MALLDFALGFGQGAAGAVAYDRKSQLDMQRQANLDRLRAQYATEAQFGTARRVAGLAQSDDPEDRMTAQIMGAPVEKPEMTGNQRDFEYFASLLSEGNEEAATLFGRQAGILSEGTDPSSVREVNALADSMGISRGSPEYIALLNERIMKPETQINMGPTETEFAKALGKQDVERLGEIEARAMRSMDQMAELDRITSALDSGQFTTGVFSQQRVFLAQLATFAGLDSSEIPGLGNAATADTLDAAANMIAANLLGDVANNAAMRGATALLNLVKESGPQLSRTMEGNRILVEVLARKAQREQEVAKIAQRYARLGTFRPEGQPSFMEAVMELNEEDPIVSPELRERIMTARDRAPSAAEAFEQGQPPRINVTIGPSSSPQAVRRALDDAGVPPGGYFIDGSGAIKRRPMQGF